MSQDMEFTVTEEHIKLLRNAYVKWDDCEFGAPAIDCKRPYGNSSVLYDVAEILGYKRMGEDWSWPSQELYDKLNRLHKETLTALQIFLSIGIMEPGYYKSTDYGSTWSKHIKLDMMDFREIV